MTTKEKAIDLVGRYYDYVNVFDDEGNANYQQAENNAKQCALIAVNEIIDALEKYDDRNDTFELQNMDGDFRYWDKVKQEIEKL